jgi:hypothetical protein
MRKEAMGLAVILGLMVGLALPPARAADTGREHGAGRAERPTAAADADVPLDLTTEDVGADEADAPPTAADETACGEATGTGKATGTGQPPSGRAARSTCGYYDSVGIWNRTTLTVVYWYRHPLYYNNQWVHFSLGPNQYRMHSVRGSTHGQYAQIAYDWDLCHAGNQFTYFYPVYKTVYKCSAPGVNDASWYHITRRNTCVIGM